MGNASCKGDAVCDSTSLSFLDECGSASMNSNEQLFNCRRKRDRAPADTCSLGRETDADVEVPELCKVMKTCVSAASASAKRCAAHVRPAPACVTAAVAPCSGSVDEGGPQPCRAETLPSKIFAQAYIIATEAGPPADCAEIAEAIPRVHVDGARGPSRSALHIEVNATKTDLVNRWKKRAAAQTALVGTSETRAEPKHARLSEHWDELSAPTRSVDHVEVIRKSTVSLSLPFEGNTRSHRAEKAEVGPTATADPPTRATEPKHATESSTGATKESDVDITTETDIADVRSLDASGVSPAACLPQPSNTTYVSDAPHFAWNNMDTRPEVAARETAADVEEVTGHVQAMVAFFEDRTGSIQPTEALSALKITANLMPSIRNEAHDLAHMHGSTALGADREDETGEAAPNSADAESDFQAMTATVDASRDEAAAAGVAMAEEPIHSEPLSKGRRGNDSMASEVTAIAEAPWQAISEADDASREEAATADGAMVERPSVDKPDSASATADSVKKVSASQPEMIAEGAPIGSLFPPGALCLKYGMAEPSTCETSHESEVRCGLCNTPCGRCDASARACHPATTEPAHVSEAEAPWLALMKTKCRLPRPQPCATHAVPFVELPMAFDADEQKRALCFLEAASEAEATWDEPTRSFLCMHPKKVKVSTQGYDDLAWLVNKMIDLGETVDRLAGWGHTAGRRLRPIDDMMFQHFGPDVSHRNFGWHCDEEYLSRPRDLSILMYFDDPATYEGGYLEVKAPHCGQCWSEQHLLSETSSAPPPCFGARPQKSQARVGHGATLLDVEEHVLRGRFPGGTVIVFPAKTLEHRVTPVTWGLRRSLLLMIGSNAKASRGSVDNWAAMFASPSQNGTPPSCMSGSCEVEKSETMQGTSSESPNKARPPKVQVFGGA